MPKRETDFWQYRCDWPGGKRLYASVEALTETQARDKLPGLVLLCGFDVSNWRVKLLQRWVSDPEDREIAFWLDDGKYTANAGRGVWVMAGRLAEFEAAMVVNTAEAQGGALPDLQSSPDVR